MLDLIQLTDLELRTLIRAIVCFKNDEKGISEKVTSARLESEMCEEANKRCLEVVPRWQ